MISYGKEILTDSLLDEMVPLLEAHYNEIAWKKDKIKLSINRGKYLGMQDMGIVKTFTARDGGQLIGYAVFFISTHMHYKDTKFATNDVVYLEPSKRGRGSGALLLEVAERHLVNWGCEVINLHVKNCLNWAPLAEKLGYEPVEQTWSKWVGE